MVNLVIVSHSRRLAEGVVELAQQMTQGKVPMVAVGGIDDPENPIGTDAVQIQAAIESVYSDNGVVVLMDLGSAILSAELALELMPPEQAAQVYLCAAPLVEGAVAAAVQAAAGSPATAVMQEAMSALQPKQSQLGVATAGEQPSAGDEQTDAGVSARLTVQNKMGLHARPAARFVSTAVQFQAHITVQKGERSANAKSMNQVATLGVRQGETIKVTAVGADAVDALTAIQALATDNFGDGAEETLPATAVASTAGDSTGNGVAASPGIAIGPVYFYQPTLPEVKERQIKDSAAEVRRLDAAVATAVEEIRQRQQTAVVQMGDEEAAIFQAHRLILQDPDLQQDAQRRIHRDHMNAEAAWQQAYQAVAAQYAAIDNPYMRARAADVHDVGEHVLRQLLGVVRPSLDLAKPAILLAETLTPSDTAQLDPALVLGIVTARGGATGHSAILARSLGIPAVVGVGALLAEIKPGQIIAIDGRRGQIWPAPDAETLADLRQQRQEWLAEQQAAKAAARAPAMTKDGHQLEIAANIGSAKETAVALQFGAEGVGLFRTEFLFMDRDSAPDEEEQYAAYYQVAAAMGQRPVIIRTLDVGGDKPLSYLGLAKEENPFLGWRGIRFCLNRPDIFKPQLRAILRASHGHNVKLMFPMIGTLAEFQAAKAVLAEVQAELRRAKIPFDEQMEVGLMIEVPAAVVMADQLAPAANFFSIGTNDLTQYLMAADRGNTRVADLADALHPAVLRMVAQVVKTGHEAGIWVGMCGEMAGNPLAAPILVGLGLDELSMPAPAIPAVKAAIRDFSQNEAVQLAQDTLALASATAVTHYLQKKAQTV